MEVFWQFLPTVRSVKAKTNSHATWQKFRSRKWNEYLGRRLLFWLYFMLQIDHVHMMPLASFTEKKSIPGSAMKQKVCHTVALPFT